MFAFLCRCRLVWCVILLIMLMAVICLTLSQSCPFLMPPSRFHSPARSSVAFFDSTNFSFTIFFLCSICILLFLFYFSLLLYARVWNFCLLFASWKLPMPWNLWEQVQHTHTHSHGYTVCYVPFLYVCQREHPQARACEF